MRRRATARFVTPALTLAACLAVTAASRPRAARGGAEAKSPPGTARITAAPEEVEAEEYAVISAFINGLKPETPGAADKPERVLVIQETTTPWLGFTDDADSFAAGLKESSTELLAETVEDYKAKNRGEHKLAARFDTRVNYFLAGAEVLEGFFKKDGPAGWEGFYKKYPNSNGFVDFSRVGFNKERTQALLYQGHHCGGLCGGGACLLFVRKDGAWTLKGPVGGVWVS